MGDCQTLPHHSSASYHSTTTNLPLLLLLPLTNACMGQERACSSTTIAMSPLPPTAGNSTCHITAVNDPQPPHHCHHWPQTTVDDLQPPPHHHWQPATTPNGYQSQLTLLCHHGCPSLVKGCGCWKTMGGSKKERGREWGEWEREQGGKGRGGWGHRGRGRQFMPPPSIFFSFQKPLSWCGNHTLAHSSSLISLQWQRGIFLPQHWRWSGVVPTCCSILSVFVSFDGGGSMELPPFLFISNRGGVNPTCCLRMAGEGGAVYAPSFLFFIPFHSKWGQLHTLPLFLFLLNEGQPHMLPSISFLSNGGSMCCSPVPFHSEWE